MGDVDELSLVMDPGSDMVDMSLHSILRRSSPGEELFPLATSPTSNVTTTLGRSNEVVRFANNLARNQESDTNPRILNPNRSSTNLHFYYG